MNVEMNKTRWMLLLAATLVAVVMIQGCKNADYPPINMGELDSLKMVTLDSTHFQLTTIDARDAYLAVVYNPFCDHCQLEADEFHHNMKKLENVTVLMIGSEELDAMEEFSVKYGLNNFKNVRFAYASPVLTYNILGAYQLPHMRLYDKDLKPIRDFAGTYPVDSIVSYIRK